MAVKGLATPVEVYELTGISAARSRLQAAAARGLSRFVGRDAEIQQLRRAVDQARQGRGQVAAVVGGPGVGKSRLTFELTHSHRLEGWLILQAGAVSYGKATSYLPVIDLLKNYFRIGDRESPREIREKVTGRILMLDRALEATLPALLALLDVSGDDPQWQALDPPQRRQRTLDAVKRLLVREAQVQPLLVVFEDLHWIDSETQALLDSLVESLPPARILLLVNYRPEYEHHWGSKTSYTQLRLDPLPRESAFELLHGLLGEDGTIEPLTPILIERTEGNPFFLEETVRALVETKALVGERGAYRLAKVLTDIQVPPTVQAILAARIDRLSPEDKRLLQSAAVIGKDVPFALLAAIAEEREEELRQGLAHLQAAEFLYEVSLFPDLEYTFMHALTHEVAYGGVLHERRRALHARLVEVIETLHGDRLAEHVEQLAHHAFLAEVWQKAATYLHEAAVKANDRCAFRQAAGSFEQALGAMAKLPDSRAKTEQSIDIMCRIRGTLLLLGEAGRAFGHLREAERLARSIDDQRRLAMVLGTVSHHYWVEGLPAETRQFGEEALEIAEAVGDLSIQISASNRLGMAHMFWGEARRAQLLLRKVVELAGEDTVLKNSSINHGAVTCRALLASTLAHIGEFREGAEHGEAALRIAEHFDHPHSVAYALLHLSWLCDLQGDLPRALTLGQRGIAICRELNISFLLGSLLGTVGLAQVLSGRPDEALLGLREAVAIQEAMGYRSTMSVIVSILAEAYLAAGQLPAASDHARRALTLARECGERFQEARGLWILGQIHAHPDHPDLEAAEPGLPPVTRARQRTRHAPARRRMPSGPRQAVPPHREPTAGRGAPGHRDDDVRRDGDAFLAGKGRRRAGSAPVTPCLSLGPLRKSATRGSWLNRRLGGSA